MLTGYAFLRKPGTGTGAGMEMGDGLKNSVVFTWGFVEVVTWFWVSWCRRGIFFCWRDRGRVVANGSSYLSNYQNIPLTFSIWKYL